MNVCSVIIQDCYRLYCLMCLYPTSTHPFFLIHFVLFAYPPHAHLINPQEVKYFRSIMVYLSIANWKPKKKKNNQTKSTTTTTKKKPKPSQIKKKATQNPRNSPPPPAKNIEFDDGESLFFSITIPVKCVPPVNSPGQFCQIFKVLYYWPSLSFGHCHDVLFCFHLFLILLSIGKSFLQLLFQI